jgi:hypothetical protein
MLYTCLVKVRLQRIQCDMSVTLLVRGRSRVGIRSGHSWRMLWRGICLVWILSARILGAGLCWFEKPFFSDGYYSLTTSSRYDQSWSSVQDKSSFGRTAVRRRRMWWPDSFTSTIIERTTTAAQNTHSAKTKAKKSSPSAEGPSCHVFSSANKVLTYVWSTKKAVLIIANTVLNILNLRSRYQGSCMSRNELWITFSFLSSFQSPDSKRVRRNQARSFIVRVPSSWAQARSDSLSSYIRLYNKLRDPWSKSTSPGKTANKSVSNFKLALRTFSW